MKGKIMNLHLDFVRHGQFEEARKVFRLLRNHKVWLNGFDDVTFNVESAIYIAILFLAEIFNSMLFFKED